MFPQFHFLAGAPTASLWELISTLSILSIDFEFCIWIRNIWLTSKSCIDLRKLLSSLKDICFFPFFNSTEYKLFVFKIFFLLSLD